MAAVSPELEYYIRFPNPPVPAEGDGEEPRVPLLDEHGRVPVVLLFGWAGAKDRYLAKYSRIYEDKGLITVRYTAPVKCLFWRRAEMISIGERLVRLLADLALDTHPLFVHCFSNGGAFLYQNFSLALEDTVQPVQIKGVIFDSAPGKRRITSLYKAISAILGGNIFYNVPMSCVTTMFLSVIWLYEIIWNYFRPNSKYNPDPLGNLKNEQYRFPQHFIYSKADDLISYTDIEYFADYRRQLGVQVTCLRFENSPHVKHYIEHPESYVNSVCTFIMKCLTRDSPSS